MNSKVILGIVTAIVMVAGFIAVQPLQQAAAVHTTILSSTSQVRNLNMAAKVFPDAAAGTVTITCNAPFIVNGGRITTTHNNAADEFGATTITVDARAVTITTVITDPAANVDLNDEFSTKIVNGISANTSTNVVTSTVRTTGAGAVLGDTIAADIQVTSTNQATCSAV